MPGPESPTWNNGVNPMEITNQFPNAKQTGMGFEEDEVNNDIEETAVKPLLSPTAIVHQQQNQTHTTNKFSNFGFFAGSPRQTAHVDIDGNIEQSKEDEIEVSIEEAIEENITELDKDRVRALTRQKSQNTKPDQTHPQTLMPKKTISPEIKEGRKTNKFSNKFAHPISNKVPSPAREVKAPQQAQDHLRVSMVRENEHDSPAKYVEIAMAQSDNEDDEQGESDAEFYQPLGLSP